MSSVGPSLLGGMVAGVVSGCVITPVVLALLIVRLYRPPARLCPNCATPLARFSRPKNLDQALWGSRACPNCGHTVPGRGR